MGGVFSATTTDSYNPNSPSDSPVHTDSQNSNFPPNSLASDNNHQPQPQPQPHAPESSVTGTQKTQESKPQSSDSSNEAQLDNTQEGKEAVSDNGGEIEGEEEGECGFCLFMKGGGCKDSFVDWEKCVEEAEQNKEDVVEKCFEVTSTLRKCMEAHADYYEPILRAEKAAHEEATKELEKEKAAEELEK